MCADVPGWETLPKLELGGETLQVRSGFALLSFPWSTQHEC